MKVALGVVIAIGMGVLAVSCGSSTDCHKGDSCVCSSADVCEWNCVDAGCTFSFTGQGAATFTCPSGGCSLAASGQGTSTFSCAGGNCTVASSGQGDVNLDCAGGGCTTTCGGEGSCNTTQCPSCTCNEATLTATCSVQ